MSESRSRKSQGVSMESGGGESEKTCLEKEECRVESVTCYQSGDWEALGGDRA